MPLFASIVSGKMAEKHAEKARAACVSSIYSKVVTEGITAKADMIKLAKSNKKDALYECAVCRTVLQPTLCNFVTFLTSIPNVYPRHPSIR